MPFVGLQDFADHTSKWVKHAQAGHPVVVATNRKGTSFASVNVVPGASETERKEKVNELIVFKTSRRARKQTRSPRSKMVERKKREAKFVAMRELSRKTHQMMSEVRDADQLMIVTVRGTPEIVIENVDTDALAAAAIGQSAEYHASMAEAERDLESGKTKTLDQFIERLAE